MHFCPVCGAPLPKTEPLSSAPSDPATAATVIDQQASPTKSARAADLVGQTLDGKYHIIALLGSGGMGTVYKAKRLHIGDTVAVKVLHKELVGDFQAIERFRREARAAARLKHANAVAIYDSAVTGNGMVYMAMELVEGRSLAELIREQGFLPPKYAANIFAKVCSALDEAHQQNIVHRDLKPDNILVNTVTSEPDVKVLDFGIAKIRDIPAESGTLTQKGMLLGTPKYMSPEQCMGEEIDGRADIYSLGVILYEMLTGVLPFDSSTPTAVIVQHVTQPPPPLREINSYIPANVETVVMHALQKRKEDRPQTAGALAQELLSAVNSFRPARSGVTGMGNLAFDTRMDSISSTHANLAAVRNDTPQGAQAELPPVTWHDVPAPEKRKTHRAALLALAGLAGVLFLLTAFWLIRSYRVASSEATNQGGSDTGGTRVQANGTASPLPATPPLPPAGMTYVSGGDFLMGRQNGVADEGPPHQVTVKPFFIDILEVTCQDYKKFLEATGHRPPQGWTGTSYPAGWARRPVIHVDWNDANAYAKWAGKRLPSEVEWEFAARGADGRLYPWGNKWKPQAANAHTTSHHHPDNVGTHKAGPSPFGAYDMVGNVWEWTTSDLAAYEGGSLSVTPAGETKVIRGGSCHANDQEATTTFRKGLPPTGGDYHNVGIRCVKDLS